MHKCANKILRISFSSYPTIPTSQMHRINPKVYGALIIFNLRGANSYNIFFEFIYR